MRVGIRGAAAIVVAMLIGGTGQRAHAQFPDVLSPAECPGCAAVQSPFEGVWSTALTAPDEPGWALADFACATACTPAARSSAAALLGDAHRPAVELLPALAALGSRPLRFGCDALPFAAQVASPLPLSIRRDGDALVLRYEEGNAVRTIALAGGAPAASTARFERDALVIETRGAGLQATERYTRSADGRWLELTLQLAPAGKGQRPTTLTKRWVRAANARVATHGCDAMSAGLEASLADYVDPRKLDARR
jgi:hypothetical protein